MEIKVELTKTPKVKPATEKLAFGNFFSDHMFIMDYQEGKGWHDARIVPYSSMSYEPAIMVFHYGQAIFEGLKAYKAKGEIVMFRPDENFKRLNNSCDALCIPKIDEAFAVEALKKLVDIDRDWVPDAPDTSLYIRPFIIATEPHIGVHPASNYQFMIITGPVGAYYKEGLNPVKIFVESHYVRAVKGGLGEAKASANYAASLKAQQMAAKKGYTQVLWLDGVERKYVEEVGTMNVMFKIAGKIVTAPLDGSILPGITRDSCLKILKSFGYEIEERKLSIQELIEASKKGILEEAWGTGTAAVITPIGELYYQGFTMKINNFEVGEVTKKLFEHLKSIQFGEFKYLDWSYEVK